MDSDISVKLYGSCCPITQGTYLHTPYFFVMFSRRQLSNRSMFHAGRKLHDKEICYFKTVTVTANVCIVILVTYQL